MNGDKLLACLFLGLQRLSYLLSEVEKETGTLQGSVMQTGKNPKRVII